MEMKNIYVPEVAQVVQAETVTALETFIEVRLPGGRDLGHQPGQFVQVSPVRHRGSAHFDLLLAREEGKLRDGGAPGGQRLRGRCTF